jgi:uncharacterized DUF497 family protein
MTNFDGIPRRLPPTGATTASLSMMRSGRSAIAFAVERFDDRENYGEERINLLGMCEGVILHVTYTERGEHIWIISARRATRHEQDDYYRENAR